MISRVAQEDIMNLILFIKENGGKYTKEILQKDDLDIERCVGLYYGSLSNIKIRKSYYEFRGKRYTFGQSPSVDDCTTIAEIINSDISRPFHETFAKLGWEYEQLKYFESEPENYRLFLDTLDILGKNETVHSEND